MMGAVAGCGAGALGVAGAACGVAGRSAGAGACVGDFALVRPSSRAFGLATGEEWAVPARAGGRFSSVCGEGAAGRIASLVEDLARHMLAEGELSADGSIHVPDDGLVDAPVFEQRAKLVLMEGVEGAYVVPSGQDWAHDALGEAAVVPGMVYSDGDAFLPGEACIDGYFQADFDGRWVRVERGRAAFAGRAIAWRESLEEFPELLAELSSFEEAQGAGEGFGADAWRDCAAAFAGAPAATKPAARRSA